MTPEEQAAAVQLYGNGNQRLIPVGHHWAPVTVIGGFLNVLSQEAQEYFAGAYSGPTRTPHRFDTYGGVRHIDYNLYVKQELEAFIKANRITPDKPMTKEQAQRFSENIRTGEYLTDPTRAAKIKAFNEAIVRDLRRPLPSQDIATAIARGKAYIQANPGRYKAMVLVGATFYFLSLKAASAADVGTKTAAAFDQLAIPGGLYEQLLRAAEAGETDKVRVLLVGDGSLSEDPVARSRHVFGVFANAFVDADNRLRCFVDGFHYALELWIIAYLNQNQYGPPPVEESFWPSWWPSWPSSWWPF
jgi:hypothetical protein